jgi:serine/threonine protein kinase
MDCFTMDEQTIFNDALEKRDRRERAAYLAEACGRDEVLRQKVEVLLALHEQAGDFLEHSPIQQAALDSTADYDKAPSGSGVPTDLSLSFLRPSEKANCLGMLGPYEITGIIGRGAMGVVLKARDTKLNRTVAVKVLAPELADNPRARKRFPREAQSAAAVVHPHVVTIHAVGEEKNLPYLVMECVDGVSLHDKIHTEGPLELKEILRIGSEIADGLAAAHRQGLIHRDIKPANILLENGVQRVKLTDFGLARAEDDLSLTLPHEVPGTPMFMSPEQANCEHIDHRTDLFSLGSVLYTMCTGRQPFPADSAFAVMRRVCDSTPRPIRELNPDIPEWLIEIIDRLMHKNADDRFQTAQEVSDLLRQNLDELLYRVRSQCNRPAPLVPGVPSHPRPIRKSGSTIPEIPFSTSCADRLSIASSGAKSMPASLDQFLRELRLLHRGSVRELVSRLTTEKGPPDVARVAHELVRNKVLTPYQAAALYQGKGKGLLVGPYEVLDRIGTGGMGMVFKAVHREYRAVVALKVLPPSFSRKNWTVVNRFRREAESLARIHHPNIVRCFEHVKEVDGVYYLVMEYVNGRDLKFLVEKQGVFPVEQALDCLLQTAKGLQSAHSLEIIHRDIKPANLMLDRTDTIRILDFGLARVTLSDPWLPDEGDSTASRAIMGTIPYMSPEQATNSKKADARSDIYSLGCTLHFLLTGRPPYSGGTWSEMYLAHRQAPIPSLRADRRSVPDYLDALFIRMLAKDPADRPPTMASVIASIELALDKSRARPNSSQTIPIILPDDPTPSEFEPTFSLDDLKIECPAKSRRKRFYYTGPRLRPPVDWDYTLLAKYLLLTGALIVMLIVLIELLLFNARGAEPVTAATEDQPFACVRFPSRRSLIPRPAAGATGTLSCGISPSAGAVNGQNI